MIDIEKLRAVNHLVTHADCPDGRASAMIIRDVMPHVKVTFAQYNTDHHKSLPAEPGMLFCDFSPHPDTVKQFLDVGTLVLDHHRTAKSIVAPFVEAGLGAFGDEVLNRGVCGASLAYTEVWKAFHSSLGEEDDTAAAHRRTVSELAITAGIRDTWVKESPRFREACEQADALTFWPWEKIESASWRQWKDLLEIGPILYGRSLTRVDKSIEKAHRFVSPGGRRVMVFEGTKPTSDAAEKMADSVDLTMGFMFLVEDGKQKLIYSTRSRGSFDCSAFSAAYGGGGHTNAAGFPQFLQHHTPQPYALAEMLLAQYEKVEEEWVKIFTSPTFKEIKEPAEVFAKLSSVRLWKDVWNAPDPRQLSLFP